MKRVLSILFMVVLLVFPIIAKTTITHWMHYSPARVELILEMVEEFMAANPDIEIELQAIPEGEYKTKLLAALAAGSGPDVAQIPSNAMTEFYNYGLIQPFPESVVTPESIINDYIPAAVEKLVIEGEVYGVPTDVQTIVLFYNPVLFEAAGLDPNRPPQDWNELIEYARKTTIWQDGKMVQSGWGIAGYHPVVETFMRQAGATFWDESGEKIVFEEAQLEALKFITDAVKVEKVYVPEFGSRWTGFKQIKQAMVFGHGAMVGSFLSTGSKDLVFKTALAPAHPVTGSRANVITNWALVIMSDADDSEAAAKWLTYITSADAQKKWMLKTGELPSLKKVLEDPDLLSNDLYVPIFESLKYAVPTFSRGWADPASELREIAYNEIINNNMDPKTALEKAIKEINIYLEETFSQF